MSGTTSIPASEIVNVNPSVLSAGGTALDLNGLILTTNSRVPVGTVQTFPSTASVSAYFGPTATETTLATVYFLGFDNSTVKPGALLFSQYPTGAVSAYVRGSNVAGAGLAALQAIPSGALTVSIDGSPVTSSIVTLASVTSFSQAAQTITAALGTIGPTQAAFTGSITGTVLTVTSVASGALAVGQQITGTGVTSGTTITSMGTGTAGLGTYNISPGQSVASEALTAVLETVTFDAQTGAFVVTSSTTGTGSSVGFPSGALAAPLGLTKATGAVQSLGAVAATPASALDAVAAITQDWASFMTAFDPDNGSGNGQKLAFATWVNGKNKRFVYSCWDTDITSTQSGTTGHLGAILKAGNYDGTALIYAPVNGASTAAFLCGAIASVDFNATQGRVTFAFKGQSGLGPDVTSQVVARNLKVNGYSYYGNFSTANDAFTFLYPGSVSGAFGWLDSYVNQIWFTNQCQLALMVLLTQAKSIPYNAAGYAMIRASLTDPINQAVNFGAFQPGVTLSNLQAIEVNTAAGLAIATTLSNLGWYLQIKDASPQVRVARGSPPCMLWYTDGESVQSINLASIEVQ